MKLLKINRLTVLYSDSRGNNGKGDRLWHCRCECGNEVLIDQYRLSRQIAKQCKTCAMKENGERQRDSRVKHGHAMKRDKPASRTYRIWSSMKHRCFSKNHMAYHRYGGRGITVCERWLNFENFLSDVGVIPDHLSIDRINNDGNYEPDNVRLATSLEQCQNTSRNRFIEYNGEKKTVSEWAKEKGMHKHTLRDRLNRGWSIEDALNRPPRPLT